MTEITLALSKARDVAGRVKERLIYLSFHSHYLYIVVNFKRSRN